MENPLLQSLEVEHSLLKQKYNKSFVWLIPCAALILLALAFAQYQVPFIILLFCGIVFVIITIVLAVKARKRLSNFFSEKVVRVCFEQSFDNAVYNKKMRISDSVVFGTGLFSSHYCDEVSGSDYASGTYKDINFEQSDLTLVHTETHTDGEGNTHTDRSIVYKGRWLIFDFKKPFSTDLQLLEKEVSGFFGKLFNKKSNVETESIDFNNKFTILAQDAHNAFYILTPHFKEYIMSTENRIKGRLYFCFQGGKVHEAVLNMKDSLEYSSNFKTIEELHRVALSDIALITELIDELRLCDSLYK